MGAGGDKLADRLRRLRHEESQAAAPARPLPIWARRRLERRRAPRPAATPSEPPAELEAETFGERSVQRRARHFGEDHLHGGWRLAEVDRADPGAIARIAGDPALESIDLRRATYLDIETTGLAGGAGTWPFLVALGWFEDERFTLWQGFLRGPEEEPALLEAIATLVRRRGALVSFFGKVFDRHRLEDKMRVHGIDPPFAERPHLDLYHPLARLYKAALPDTRLATMESELVGLEREDDLPGSFAPAAWFDYLAGRPHRLEAVFQHNQDDVLSLVTLAAHLGRSFEETRGDGSPLEGPPGPRAFALARLCRSQDRALERRWLERALAVDGGWPEAERREARLALGRNLRHAKEVEAALALLEALSVGSDAPAAQAAVELAMLCEHGLKRPADALEACGRARRAALECGWRDAAREKFLEALGARVERLERRVAKDASPAPE